MVNDKPRLAGTAMFFCFLTAAYLTAFFAVELQANRDVSVGARLIVVPVISCMATVTYLLRYVRWYRLLRSDGAQTSFGHGFTAYLSGFAFTATPGKLGELARIRYYRPLGVPAHSVFAAFIYERALDLVVVLALAALFIGNARYFGVAAGFVSLILAALLVLSWKSHLLERIRVTGSGVVTGRLRVFMMTLREGIRTRPDWYRLPALGQNLLLGLCAWTITSWSFVFLLQFLEISIPVAAAFSIYPLAMLVGAASMLPGGVGSTELAIVALLRAFNVDMSLAITAALLIRIATLWFACATGLIMVFALEILLFRHERHASRPGDKKGPSQA